MFVDALDVSRIALRVVFQYRGEERNTHSGAVHMYLILYSMVVLLLLKY